MKHFLYLISIVLLLASCQEEMGTPFYEGQEVTLCAAMPNNQSADMTNSKLGGVMQLPNKQRVSGYDMGDVIDLKWDEGDQILVTVGDKSAVFTLSSGAGTGYGTFNGMMPASGNSYKVDYPADYNESVLDVQTYKENGFGKGLMKLSTRENGTIDGGFTLSAENAVLGLQLRGDLAVSKIVVTNKLDNNTEKTYTLNCSPEVDITEGKLFYIVVPAGEWSNGMKVEVYNENGVVVETKEKTSAFSFSAGSAMMMPEVEMHDVLQFEVNGVKFNMVYVEGGTFTFNGKEVVLPNYYIGQTEVTQQLWKTIMDNNPSNWQGEHQPVEKVSWEDCQIFISLLNQLLNKHFRMPSKSEWEYAASGGKSSNGYQYSGSKSINEVAWYKHNSEQTPHEVATLSPNQLGIFDMSGNVWEWCQSYFDSEEKMRVVKGGSFYDEASSCRIDATTGRESSYKSYIGLRLVLDMHNYVDLGLPSGTLWATCNVGASRPEEYGDYFAWGEVEEKEVYLWSNYKHGTTENITKYNATDGLTILQQKDDAAHVNWGGEWRMPTANEQTELMKQCVWKWTKVNNIEGYQVVGPNSNHIFLPAAGYITDIANQPYNTNIMGYQWSSTNKSGINAYRMHFGISGTIQHYSGGSRACGASIRSVYDSGK